MFTKIAKFLRRNKKQTNTPTPQPSKKKEKQEEYIETNPYAIIGAAGISPSQLQVFEDAVSKIKKFEEAQEKRNNK